MQIILQCLVFLSLIFIALSQDCLNKDGNPVDWWFILKMPSSKKNAWSGLDYFYCDNTKKCDKFLIEEDELASDKSPLMRTTKTINFEETDVITILWNDQPSEELQYPRNAHSKGIMRAKLNGDEKAFIISHSAPRFPKLNSENEIDKTVDNNFIKHGQHFLCLSTTTSDIDKYLADLYLIAEISIYRISKLSSKSSSSKSSKDYENLNNLWNSNKSSKETRKKSADQEKKLTFKTRGGQSFEVFSKNEKKQWDIYANVIAPHLQQDFVLESWVRQYGKSGLEDPECKEKFKTFSNELIKFTGTKGSNPIEFEYKYTKDHSKYGITLPKDSESASASGSFITKTHHTLKGQIFASNQHSRKREEQNSLGGGDETDTKMLGKKRYRDEEDSEDSEITTSSKRKKEDVVIHKNQVCISDLNRQKSQWERGGLVYCFYNEGLWKVMKEAFIGIQKCEVKADA